LEESICSEEWKDEEAFLFVRSEEKDEEKPTKGREIEAGALKTAEGNVEDER